MEKNQENNDIRISSGINLSDDISEAIKELRNMSNEEFDALMRNTKPPLLTTFNPLTKLDNDTFELTEKDFNDEFEKYAKAFLEFLNEEPKGTLTNAGLKIIENVKLRENILKEGLLYGVELDDERCRNGIMEFINCSAKEPSTDELKRKFREVSKFGTIPTEKDFKEEAKKLKVSGNFSSLGAAQNALAKKYGFKEYRAIKSKFSEK